MEFLSRSEIEEIGRTSLRLLANVGIVVNSKSVSEMLIDAGALRSSDGKRILIPEAMVKSALATTPKSLLLASRDGKRDMRVPTEGPMFVANGGEGVYVEDLTTGQSRTATSEDIREFMVLVDDLDPVDFAWGMVGALEQPNSRKNAVELKICLENTTKHIQGGATSLEEARVNLKMLSVLAGDMDEFRKKPFFSAVQCPISPLTFEEGLSEAQAEFAKAGVPVVSMVAAVAGLTAPVTLSGTITQTNAENLASLVISQTAKKGAPWIYSGDSAPGDLKIGSINYGALEGHLLRAGIGQMGRHYGLPVMCAGCGLEETSKILADVREGVPYMAVMGSVNSDLASGFGGIDNAAGASLEQLVLDAWVWDAAKEFLRKFEADAESISFETIREAALDGNFLGKRHTLTRFKKESAALSKPEAIFSGRPSSGNRMDLLRRARKEADRLLAAPRKRFTTASESAALEEIVKSL